MSPSTFPILRDSRDARAHPNGRRSVPWEWVAPHEAQARRNHDQTLKRLAERGGLSPAELLCIVHGKPLRVIFQGMVTDEQAERWLATWDGEPGTLETGWTGPRCAAVSPAGRCTLPAGHDTDEMDVAPVPREHEFAPYPEPPDA